MIKATGVYECTKIIKRKEKNMIVIRRLLRPVACAAGFQLADGQIVEVGSITNSRMRPNKQDLDISASLSPIHCTKQAVYNRNARLP